MLLRNLVDKSFDKITDVIIDGLRKTKYSKKKNTKVKINPVLNQSANIKEGEPGSSKSNPLVVGMVGSDIAKVVVERNGVWYQTDGLGNGFIR